MIPHGQARVILGRWIKMEKKVSKVIQMKPLKQFVNQWKKRIQSTDVDEPFVTLIQVAQESPEIRKTLLSILEKPEFHRESLINTLIEEMRFKGAPPALISGVAGLLNPTVAQKALELLTSR